MRERKVKTAIANPKRSSQTPTPVSNAVFPDLLLSPRYPQAIAPAMGRLTSLTLDQCPVKPSTVQFILDKCPELTSIVVSTQHGLLQQPQVGTMRSLAMSSDGQMASWLRFRPTDSIQPTTLSAIGKGTCGAVNHVSDFGRAATTAVVERCVENRQHVLIDTYTHLSLPFTSESTRMVQCNDFQDGRALLEYLLAQGPSKLSKIEVQRQSARGSVLGNVPHWLVQDPGLCATVLDWNSPRIVLGTAETADERIAPFMVGRDP